MRARGVPKGYRHNWYYKGGRWRERKTGPGRWAFKYTSSKSRAGSTHGGPPIGTRIRWLIRGVQTATKVSGRKYLTTMRGTKRLLRIRTRR